MLYGLVAWRVPLEQESIYLALSLFQLGIAIWANSLWLVATLVGAAALIPVALAWSPFDWVLDLTDATTRRRSRPC